MRGRRLIHSIGLLLSRGGFRRAEYLRKHQLLSHIGTGCSFQRRKLPLYPELIFIGNNVHIASNVSFLTHDITHVMLNRMGVTTQEKIGCIEIGNNVFVGAGTRILYDVKIGSNVIIVTGSTITKDIPDNSIVAGSPARVIGRFEDYLKKREAEESYPKELRPKNQEVSHTLAEWCWQRFKKKRNEK